MMTCSPVEHASDGGPSFVLLKSRGPNAVYLRAEIVLNRNFRCGQNCLDKPSERGQVGGTHNEP